MEDGDLFHRFHLAKTLGRPLSDIASMDYHEFLCWIAYTETMAKLRAL